MLNHLFFADPHGAVATLRLSFQRPPVEAARPRDTCLYIALDHKKKPRDAGLFLEML
jgi:hypothetical protein